jgi:hypothetical protein
MVLNDSVVIAHNLISNPKETQVNACSLSVLQLASGFAICLVRASSAVG